MERQLTPVHSVRELFVARVTDFGGERVRQSAFVRAFGPKLLSISQLMFFDGEKNSVLVDVCGTRVPDVVDVVPPVLEVVDGALVVVVAVAVEVVVEFEEDGLLEQAASASAHAGRISRRTDHVRNALGIRRAYVRSAPKCGFPLSSQGGHPPFGTGGGVPCQTASEGRQSWG